GHDQRAPGDAPSPTRTSIADTDLPRVAQTVRPLCGWHWVCARPTTPMRAPLRLCAPHYARSAASQRPSKVSVPRSTSNVLLSRSIAAPATS
ncbi:MAG: hypothetical protein QOI50_1537, partial [Pseudonocardiales bacterium]|nr:hypothetical protein [Pseudonocardiales bacterium]